MKEVNREKKEESVKGNKTSAKSQETSNFSYALIHFLEIILQAYTHHGLSSARCAVWIISWETIAWKLKMSSNFKLTFLFSHSPHSVHNCFFFIQINCNFIQILLPFGKLTIQMSVRGEHVWI